MSQDDEQTDKNIELSLGSIHISKDEDSNSTLQELLKEETVSEPLIAESAVVSDSTDAIANSENQSVQTVIAKTPEPMPTNTVVENHKQSEPQISPALCVVEDPETPMSKAAPAEGGTFIFSPTLVEEEKSPNLRAQEALAKLQALSVTSSEQPNEVEASAPPESSSSLKSEVKDVKQSNDKTENQIASTKTRTLDAKVQMQPVVGDAEAASEATSTKRPFAELSHQLQQIQSLEQERSQVKAEPMPLPQLYTLYSNPELARNDVFVGEFVQVR